VAVDSPDRAALLAALRKAGATVEVTDDGILVSGQVAAAVGEIAHRAKVPLSLLRPEQAGLENVFLELVGEGGAL
jgi:ABC-2 type transport system ATP-binding protein